MIPKSISRNFKIIDRWAKRVFLVLFVYFAIFSLFFHFTNPPQSAKPRQDPMQSVRREIYSTINNPAYQKDKRGKQAVNLYRASTCGLIGEGCTSSPEDGDKNFSKSLFGGVAGLVTLPFANPPASGTYWAYSSLSNAGFVPQSQAAEGIGFAGLKPLLPLWKMFRDVAYLILVVILVAIGFMIMFRTKVKEQTVISVENALPRIVIVLLLITFSFAIAGFMIDLMYIVTSIVISVLSKNTIAPFQAAEYQNNVFGGRAQTLFDLIFLNNDLWGIGAALLSILPNFIAATIRFMVGVGTMFFLRWFPLTHDVFNGQICNWGTADGLKTICGPLFYSIAAVIGVTIGPLILSLILIVFTGLMVYFRVFFLLFAAYLRIILGLIFSPLIFLGDAIPGRNFFFKWLKHLVADLLVFPITVAMIIISHLILVSSSANIIGTRSTQDVLWRAPFLGSANSNIAVLIGVGILWIIPDVVKNLRGLMGIKDSPIKAGLGTFFGGTATGGIAGGALGKYSQFGSLGFYLPKNIKGRLAKSPLGKVFNYEEQQAHPTEPINPGGPAH